jgi:hypothetical protein
VVEHPWFTIEHDGNRVFARCACGWQSAATRAAGLAGALWDEHAAESRRAEAAHRAG